MGTNTTIFERTAD